MAEENNHDYLFAVNDKDIRAVLYDVGTARDFPDNHLEDIDLRYKPAFDFLEQAGLLQIEHYALSDVGKRLFESIFIFPDEAAFNDQLVQVLLRNPVVNLLCQSFYGRGKASVEQLRVLLNYHGIGSKDIEYSNVVSVLTLLNKYGIVVYDKKNKTFTVKKSGGFVEPIDQYYICPDTPYSNIYNMRKVIRSCQGNIFWVDKHFRKEGFEMLIDGLPYQGVSSITIISGKDNVTASAKLDYLNLRTELSNRQITLSWRVIENASFKWHDRWLVADNQCHNIPPVLAIIRGQRAEILLTKDRLDINSFMSESIPVQ